MSTIVIELYEALKQAGIAESTARAAAQAVIGIEHRETLATKGDLEVGLAKLETTLIKWNVGALLALSAIVSALVKLL